MDVPRECENGQRDKANKRSESGEEVVEGVLWGGEKREEEVEEDGTEEEEFEAMVAEKVES